MQAIHTARNIDKWTDLLTQYFVPLEANAGRIDEGDIVSQPSRSFSGSISGHRWESMTVAQLSVQSHTVTRDRSLIGANETRHFKLAIQESGRSVILQNEKEAVLHAGEFAFFDSQEPYSVIFDDDSTCQIILFPRPLLGVPDKFLHELAVTPFCRENSLAQALSSFAKQCSSALVSSRETVSRRLTENLVDLLGTVLTNEVHEKSVVSLEKLHQREQILYFIMRNLENPYLTPKEIARAHFMSVRSLHQVFEGSGETVASIVRNLRLEGCRRTLEDPTQHALTISDIAGRWGFVDAAYFSRTFRKRYGASPSQWRAKK
jgi:AraC-like DNA-binding protein